MGFCFQRGTISQETVLSLNITKLGQGWDFFFLWVGERGQQDGNRPPVVLYLIAIHDWDDIGTWRAIIVMFKVKQS